MLTSSTAFSTTTIMTSFITFAMVSHKKEREEGGVKNETRPSHGFHVPQAVVEVMIVLHSDALVLLLDLLGRHDGVSDGQGMLLALGMDRHHRALVGRSHLGIGVGEAGAHDVGPGQDKLDGALVHGLLGQEEGILMEESESWTPSSVSMSKEEQFSSRVDQQFNVIMAFDDSVASLNKVRYI